MPKRDRKKGVALLGCGAIGTRIANAIDSGAVPAVLTHVYDRDRAAAEAMVAGLRTPEPPRIVENPHLLSSQPAVDVVVEAASQDAVRDVALSVLQNRKDLMIMSAGALLDESVFDVLSDACRDFGCTIHLPSGAIAGIDGLAAAAAGGGGDDGRKGGRIRTVSLTTTKHPDSLRGAPFLETSGIDLGAIDGPVTVFEGTAAEAVAGFPANINVAALISLVAAGGDRTEVRIVADPSAVRNTHAITAEGEFGRIDIRVQNVPDPANPKTSSLAAMAAIEKLRRICSGGIHIGT